MEISLNDYLDVDQQVMTSQFISDDDIVDSIQDIHSNTDCTVDGDDDTEESKKYNCCQKSPQRFCWNLFEQHDEADLYFVMKINENW